MAIHCIIEKDHLLEGLAALQNITSKKATTLAVLSNVLIETTTDSLILTATDLEVGLRLRIPAQILEAGSITLPCKKLFEIVRESGSSSLTMEEKENNWIIITADHSLYNIAGMASAEFPEFPEYEEDNLLSFDAEIFSELIEKVIYSVSGEQENIYSLTCVLFEKEKREERSYLKMVSSDGHRLSFMEKFVTTDIDLLSLHANTLIPKKGVQELRKFCENKQKIAIAFDEKQMVVKGDDAVMVVRLKIGDFPKYESIIKTIQLKKKIKIERLPFLESLRRINIFTEDIFNSIQMDINENTMILSSQSADLGNAKDELQVDYKGESLKLAFNCRYFIDTLQVMDCSSVDVYINSNNSPCLLRSDIDEGFISIIMPMQI